MHMEVANKERPQGPAFGGFASRLRARRWPVSPLGGRPGLAISLIPGCVSQGKTRAEALANIQEAIELCLETRNEEGWRLPDKYEVVDIAVAS